MNKKIVYLAMLMIFIFSFNIAEARVFNYNDVFAVFKKAMSNRYSALNYNNKTGIQGITDYIVTEKRIATTTAYMEIASSTKITDFNKLTWFKDKFLANTGTSFNQRDKDGIKQAMVLRFQDFCNSSFNATTASLDKLYKFEIGKFEKLKNASTTDCTRIYNNAMRNKANFNNLGKIAKMLKEEDYKITKDKCISDVYAKDSVDRRAKWAILDVSLRANEQTASTTLNNCLNSTQIKDWAWTR